jgi:hypothetical protein
MKSHEEANRYYFLMTKEVAAMLSEMFKAIFPDYHRKYSAAFDAGVWIQEDTGPWLARAVVFKLQVHIHRDRRDGGPTASFAAGYFRGGAIVFTDLWAKYACVVLYIMIYDFTELVADTPLGTL